MNTEQMNLLYRNGKNRGLGVVGLLWIMACPQGAYLITSFNLRSI